MKKNIFPNFENIFIIVRFMIHIVWYNEVTKGKIQQRKGAIKMNGSMRRSNYEIESRLMAEDCNFSAYSMAAVAGGILLCLGIVLYALITL